MQLIDLNANDLTIGGQGSRRVRTNLPISRGRTGPRDFGDLLQRALTDQALFASLASFDSVILKSCFTVWDAKAAQISRYSQPYEAVIGRYLQKIPQQVVFLVTPPPPRRAITPEKKDAIETFLLSLERLTSHYPNVQVIDIYHDLANSHGTLQRRYRPFFVLDQHPNRSGSARIANLLHEKIVDCVRH